MFFQFGKNSFVTKNRFYMEETNFLMKNRKNGQGTVLKELESRKGATN